MEKTGEYLPDFDKINDINGVMPVAVRNIEIVFKGNLTRKQ